MKKSILGVKINFYHRDLFFIQKIADSNIEGGGSQQDVAGVVGEFSVQKETLTLEKG